MLSVNAAPPDSSTDPRLPPEIEHLIFTLALQSGIDNAAAVVTYLLVAKRVCDWLYPELYSVVVIHADRGSESDQLDWSQSRPPGITGCFNNLTARLKQHGKHVKSLFVNYFASRVVDGDVVSTALVLCPNLEDLLIHVRKTLIADFSVFSAVPRLKRLSASIEVVGNRDDPESIAALHQVCGGITHLDMTWNWRSWPAHPQQFLAWFPSLTHVAFAWSQRAELGEVLVSDTRLKVVVLMCGWTANAELADSEGGEDSRLVELSYSHLESWVHGAVDIWKLAERIVEERKRRTLAKLKTS